jgi:shikimate kinase/3-dehydroquinate synthase
VFVGFMGAGKSRAARRAAERIGAEVLDTDKMLEAELGEPIAGFFDREGEAAFREREETLVLSALEDAARVVALGGGALASARVREQLEPHLCVHVDVDPDLAWERSQDSGRPLARDHEAFVRLHAERRPLYEAVARAAIPARPQGVEQGALDAAIALAAAVPDSIRMIWAPASNGGYPVYSGAGALDAAGALWPQALSGRCFTVADETVQALHGERLERALAAGPGAVATVTVAPGERQKSLAEAERVLRVLARAGTERWDSLVALGGGVIGDLAGLCAALYQRGIPVVHVPTTVVAQVDSAYGGKTGVDLPEGKNYVGVFHQPAAVFTDPDVLATLPLEELRAGYAEILKTALIAGGPLWASVRESEPIAAAREAPERLRDVIEGCLRAKIAVVAQDERDHGVRASLNLGHTFAHALEAATAYSRYRHGEAVAIGLLVALRLSERRLGLDGSVREQVAAQLRDNALPTTFSGASTEELIAVAARDKKRRRGATQFVLLRSPGDVALQCEVSDDELSAAVEELRER